jgi:hypothetical protein
VESEHQILNNMNNSLSDWGRGSSGSGCLSYLLFPLLRRCEFFFRIEASYFVVHPGLPCEIEVPC